MKFISFTFAMSIVFLFFLTGTGKTEGLNEVFFYFKG